MRYTQTTFYNQLPPGIGATKLNYNETVLANLGRASINIASIIVGSTSSNYMIAIDTYTTAPTSAELPLLVLLAPTITNAASCSFTPSWGSNAYQVRDPIRNATIQSGEIISGIPALFAFDGDYFWFLGASGLAANVDYIVPPTVLTALPASGTTLQNNAEYIVSAAVNEYSFMWPANPFHVSAVFTTGATPNISFPSGTKYATGVPTFAASTTYEMDIKNGIVVCAEVVTAS